MTAEEIIEKFGGIRPMATKTGIPVTTIQGWKKRNNIPDGRMDEIKKAANENSIDLDSAASPATPKAVAKKPAKKTAPTPKKPAAKKAPAKKAAAPKAAAKPKAQTTQKIEEPVVTSERVQAKPVLETPKTAEPEKTQNVTVEDLEQVRKKALSGSIIISLIIAAIVALVAVFLFVGGTRNTTVNPDVEVLNERLNNLENETGSLSTMIKDNINQKIETLQAKTAEIESLVGKADAFLSQFGEGTIAERLAKAEQTLAEVTTNMPQIQRLLAGYEEMNGFGGNSETMQGAMTELRTIVSNMQGQVGDLTTRLSAAQEENDALAYALQDVQRQDLQAAAMLLALGQFRNSVNRNTPFEQDLEVVSNLIGDNNTELQAAFQSLAPYAESGVLTPDNLSSELKNLSGEIIMDRLAGKDTTIRDKLANRLSSVMSVTKDGESVMATPEQQAVMQATEALEAGNIQEAISLIQTLDTPETTAVDNWLYKAEGSARAQNVEVLIMKTIMDQITAFKRGGMSGLTRSVNDSVRDLVPEDMMPPQPSTIAPSVPNNFDQQNFNSGF